MFFRDALTKEAAKTWLRHSVAHRLEKVVGALAGLCLKQAERK